MQKRIVGRGAVLTFGIVAVYWPGLSGCSQDANKARPPQNPGYVEPAAPVPSPAPREGRTATLYIKGLSCPLCVQSIRKEVGAVPGITAIDIDYEAESATLSLSSRKPPTREQITSAVERSGYQVARLDMP